MSRFAMVLFALGVVAPPSALARPDARLVTYPAPAGLPPAPDYVVSIDGQSQFVYDSPVAAFVTFAFEGEVEVQITPLAHARYEDRHQYSDWGRTYRPRPFEGLIETVDVLPSRLEIQPEVEGATLSLRLDRPCRLSIEINGNTTRPLFLFADAPASPPVETGNGSVRRFEAGRVHDVGEIQLHDNETVYIAGGAVVRGWIRGEGVQHARVLGPGILDGSDAETVQTYLISLDQCQDIVVDGPVILNQQGWTVVPRQSQNLQFRNLKLLGWDNNSDGIDLCGCRDITISGCFLRNNDDCIPIKANGSTADQDVVGVAVLDSVFWNATGGNALEIGFELCTGSIRDILWRDCDVIHVENGAVFSIHNGDRATVEDVCFENIYVENADDELIDLAIGLSIYSQDCPREYSRWNPSRKSVPLELRAHPSGNNAGQWIRLSPDEMQKRAGNRGRIQNIAFRNIQVRGETLPGSVIAGYDADHRVEGVTIENLTFQGRPISSPEQGKFQIEHASDVRFLTSP